MKKRSGGLTVVALLFILGSLLSGFFTLVGLAAPRAFDQVLERVDRELGALEKNGTTAKEGEADRAEAKEQLERLAISLSETRKFLDSPVARRRFQLSALLAGGALAAGIGLFLLQPWARLLAIWQVLLAVALGVWWALTISAEGLSPPAAGAFGPADPSVQVFETISKWIGVIVSAGWAAFVVWFLNRGSVKTQFLHKPS